MESHVTFCSTINEDGVTSRFHIFRLYLRSVHTCVNRVHAWSYRNVKTRSMWNNGTFYRKLQRVAVYFGGERRVVANDTGPPVDVRPDVSELYFASKSVA